jgi:type IV/VI secretion system ImpK/VasF family protein
VTLLDLYEPLFQYICVLNRISRQSSAEGVKYDSLRTQITSLLDSIRRDAEQEPLLALQAQKLEQPVLFFVDSMIADSTLPCASEWHKKRLAFDPKFNQLAGDEKFYDLLDETLADSSKDATERLTIYFVCLGLGFTGWYSGQPEYLRKKMEVIAKRISKADGERISRICPEAYRYLDTRNLIEPPAGKIGAIIVAFVVLCIVVLTMNFYLFKIGTEGFAQSLKEIEKHDLNR